jgi:hypothetical protein
MGQSVRNGLSLRQEKSPFPDASPDLAQSLKQDKFLHADKNAFIRVRQ